ncbi:acyltransferase domain-containing protein [Rhodococcus corynebacterioides]|uniref:Acyltransferase domain-containing protein n=2 Tax=Rhodococcoides corynebacterioides TaxID=53972 RepID=A0ABS7P8Y3_9NOCA|nr:polyketide synthase Pks13 [Rhodococcus corynebacterioides]MBY6367641.1 acyltransferase domain-containing protein [Rhodococcus corynebacterioides]MBY6408025.1 acyltransferase domain-containing protein [Rhodococcus corynebacterioides]
MTVAQLREWLRTWVAEVTGQPVSQISDDRPMEEFGLSSRDAVALSGEIEELVGVTLTATVAYQHPTIASLATRIIEGEPDVPEGASDDAFYLGASAGTGHDVAIVGLATRLPGAGHTPESTWDLLIEGRDGITDLPDGRWSEFLGDARIAEAVRTTVTKGGYLDDVKSFDAEFFAMSPREAANVDPQQRLALELAWEALEHARIPASGLKGAPVGVFVGTSTNDYQMIAISDTDPHPYALTGTSTSIVANRISYYFDFRGPSVALDTACSSSLVAVHQAVRSLRSGESSVALAGGVNLILAPAATLGFGQTGVLAPDGRIKAFSSDADGMIRSEGGGLLVLKRLEDAERDGDDILAVIKGSAVNQDGRSNGLAAPNPDAQADVLRAAYRDAGILPSTVDYIEAHGTGTILGDPIEADALGRVVGRGRSADAPALLGSAKTNFGHLESAAGAAGLIKVVLAMRENTLPASLNYAGPNPYIPFDAARLQVVDAPTAWPRYSGSAVAGVSGFGFGGTNAHVVVREYVPGSTADAPADVDPDAVSFDAAAVDPEALVGESVGAPEETDAEVREVLAEVTGAGSAESTPSGEATPSTEATPSGEPELPVLLAVSASMPSRRRRTAADLADWLETEAGSIADLEAVARTLAKRNHGRSRAVVLATTRAEAITGLRAVAAGKPGTGVLSSDSPAANGAVWVFSGFGAQHRKMAKGLYAAEPLFAAALDRVDELIEDESGYSIRAIVADDAQTYEFENSQVAIFAIQVALVETLRAYGASPVAVVGHSMGEVAAAYAAGGLGLEDAVRIIVARSRLLGEGQEGLGDAEAGAMALVEFSAAEVAELAERFPGVEPSVYAAPTHTTVGGPAEPVQKLVEYAESLGKMGRVLDVRGAGHTSAVDPLLGELAAELMGIEPHPLATAVFSSVDKEAFYRSGHEPIHGVDYWTKGMRHAVWFTQAVKTAVDSGYTTFVELAPNPVALMSVAATAWAAGVPDATLIATLKRKESEPATFRAALAELYVHGHPVDLAAVIGPGEYAPIPRTAFIRKEHWLHADVTLGGSPARVALPDGRTVWETPVARVTSADELVRRLASEVLSDVVVGAVVAGDPPTTGSITTVLTPHPGGAALQLQWNDGGTFRPWAEAVVTSGAAAVSAGAPAAAAPSVADGVGTSPIGNGDGVEYEPEVVEDFGNRWDPTGSQTMEERLAIIVAESMGYAPEDLPAEIPLIELGLDSLMAVRIKNRVEFEFDIPQVQLQAVRDASLREVEKYLRYALENREEVEALADEQRREREAEQAREAGEGGEGTEAEDGAATAAPDTAESTPEPEATGPSVATAFEAPVTDTAAPVTEAAPAPSSDASDAKSFAEATGTDVAPRDAAERLTFATWATVTGQSAKGIFNPLPVLDDPTAEKLAERLSERAKGEVTFDDILDSETIEQLADIVRPFLEAGDVTGLVRTLRARPEGSTAVPVFVFHPAGSSCVVYEPLLRRLPADTPMYGLERTEGPIEKRAAEYVPILREIQGDGPYVLMGWSLGGVLSYAVASLLRAEGADVRYVGLIDTVMPYEPIPDTPEEIELRWKRYAQVGKKLYNVDYPLPYEKLAQADDDGQIGIIMDLLKMSSAKIPSGIIEHQRTSWLDNRAIQTAQPERYDGDVTLYMADKYHDDAIALEPRLGRREEHGGWGPYAPKLDIVYVGGDHLAVIDEPYIGRIAADLTKKLDTISASGPKESESHP